MCLDLFCICLQQYFIKTLVWSLMYMCLACNFLMIFIYFSLFKLTYLPKSFDWAARETTNQFGMALCSNIPNGSLLISRCLRVVTELTPSSIKSYDTTRDGHWTDVSFFRKIETFNSADFLRSSFFVYVNLNLLFPILQY